MHAFISFISKIQIILGALRHAQHDKLSNYKLVFFSFFLHLLKRCRCSFFNLSKMKLIISIFTLMFLLTAILVNADQEGKKPMGPKLQDTPYSGNVTLFMRSGDNVYTFRVRGRNIKLQRPILRYVK